MNLQTDVNGFLDLVRKGQFMDAFEKYYSEDVVMQENNDPPKVGKTQNRTAEKEFLDSVEAVHETQIKNVAFDPNKNVVMIQEYMDLTLKGMGRVKMEEIAVQTWRDGKIVEERFFYNRQ
jgi:ketosteroid isomerase-like protein